MYPPTHTLVVSWYTWTCGYTIQYIQNYLWKYPVLKCLSTLPLEQSKSHFGSSSQYSSGIATKIWIFNELLHHAHESVWLFSRQIHWINQPVLPQILYSTKFNIQNPFSFFIHTMSCSCKITHSRVLLIICKGSVPATTFTKILGLFVHIKFKHLCAASRLYHCVAGRQ